MINIRFPALLVAMAVSTAAMATRIPPTVTGTVTAVSNRGHETQATVNGRTYTVSSDTNLKSLNGALKPGQAVRFALTADGKTVILAQPVEPHVKQP